MTILIWHKDISAHKCFRSNCGFSLTESLVLLVTAVSLLWLAVPIVLVHYGIIKPIEVTKTQPVVLPVPSKVTVAAEDDVKIPLPPNSLENANKLTLPPNLERVTKGYGVDIQELPKNR